MNKFGKHTEKDYLRRDQEDVGMVPELVLARSRHNSLQNRVNELGQHVADTQQLNRGQLRK
jgi:hypothetical protein